MAILRTALDGTVPSPPVQVSNFVTDNRQPVEGAAHNGDTLPSLFIYLLNIFSKAIINQFISEAGANPKAADPVGVFTALIFSTPEFHWRGRSLIDILMAKFRVACPALFGLRGNDRTERGRTALGWRRDGPDWISEEAHSDRMTGLGAGFAAISLRDFGKSKKENPYPPTNYWTALACIVNTPKGETSNTQCIVLRGMIEGYEHRFLRFYGNAGLAALKLALIDFPNKAPEDVAGTALLRTFGVLLKEDGLYLE
jgi:nucleoporin GLE1